MLDVVLPLLLRSGGLVAGEDVKVSSGALLLPCSSGRPWWRGEGSVVVGDLLLLALVEVVFVDGAAPAGLDGEGSGVCRCRRAAGGGPWRWWDGWRMGGGGKTALWPGTFSESRSRRWRRVALAAVYKALWCCLPGGAWYGVSGVASELWAR